MRSKFIYENKRDHITQVISAAILDEKLSDEATSENTIYASHKFAENQVHDVSSQCSVFHILPRELDFYRIVDASWKSPADQAGIGWSLISKEGIPRLQGSSAIEPTSSPLVAEAMAVLLAVQHLNI